MPGQIGDDDIGWASAGSSGGGGGSVTSVATGTGLTGGTITTTGTISVAGSTANSLAGYNSSGVFSDVTVGSGLTLSGGTLTSTGGGSGTVTTVSVVSANGLAGTVATATTTPAITLSTSITGVLKGNGTAISAATAGTDYQAPITLTTTGTSGAATFSSNTLNIPQYSGGGGGVSSFSGDGTVISNSSSTGAVTATLASAAAHTVLGNFTGSSAAPTYGAPFTLTTTGSSGASTFSAGTLNIPQYSGGGGSGITGLTGDITTAQTTSGNVAALEYGQTNVITPSISSAQNNWSPTGWLTSSLPTANVIRVTNTATSIIDITGLVPPTYNVGTSGTAEGMRVTIACASGSSNYPIRLVANSGSSSSANQFGFPSNVYLGPGEDLTLIYDATASLWREYNAHKDIRTDYFGTGNDGTVTISTAVGPLTRDMYYDNLTITTGGSLVCGNCKIYVRGMLDISAAPTTSILATTTSINGGNGSATGTGGSASSTGGGGSATTLPDVQIGIIGGAGSATNGVEGAAASNSRVPNNQTGAVGAAGGAGSVGTGGAIRTGAVAQTGSGLSVWTFNPLPYLTNTIGTAVTSFTAGLGAPGGSGGGGDTTVSGGGGGGGGASSGTIWVSARYINRGSSSTASIFSAKGGNGGNGGTPTTGTPGGGGGGGSGGGGLIVVNYDQLLGSTITNALDASSGTGGTGGNGISTGTGGDGGGAGPGGKITVINLKTGTVTETLGGAAVAGTAHSGITGGAGGASVTTQQNL
jgi:hypothetical protein